MGASRRIFCSARLMKTCMPLAMLASTALADMPALRAAARALTPAHRELLRQAALLLSRRACGAHVTTARCPKLAETPGLAVLLCSMRARSLLPALLLLLLPLAVDAHPPKDAPLDGDEVMGAANAVMADMKESVPL